MVGSVPGPVTDRVTVGWRKLHKWEQSNFSIHEILLGCSNKEGWHG
jgi:hypothetical protein